MEMDRNETGNTGMKDETRGIGMNGGVLEMCVMSCIFPSISFYLFFTSFQLYISLSYPSGHCASFLIPLIPIELTLHQ